MSSTRADRGYSGSFARLRLCMVMHVAPGEGLARQGLRAAGQIGQSAHPGQGVRKGSATGCGCSQAAGAVTERWGPAPTSASRCNWVSWESVETRTNPARG